ncbi:MAG: hypothetical protein R3D05_09330 [Dongiaceae bacterium]
MSRYVPILHEHAPSALYDLERLMDERGLLTLHLLQDNSRRRTLVFDGYLAYRKRDEGSALKTLGEVKDSGGLGASFYRVEESEFLAWFEADGHGVNRGRGWMHVAVMTVNDIIDVICRQVPLFAISGDR